MSEPPISFREHRITSNRSFKFLNRLNVTDIRGVRQASVCSIKQKKERKLKESNMYPADT